MLHKTLQVNQSFLRRYAEWNPSRAPGSIVENCIEHQPGCVGNKNPGAGPGFLRLVAGGSFQINETIWRGGILLR
jgi:hypothetical protein